MKIRIKHHKELWQKEPEWVETEVEVRGYQAGDVVTRNPWWHHSFLGYFNLMTGKHHTWGQGHDHQDDFAYIHEDDLKILQQVSKAGVDRQQCFSLEEGNVVCRDFHTNAVVWSKSVEDARKWAEMIISIALELTTHDRVGILRFTPETGWAERDV